MSGIKHFELIHRDKLLFSKKKKLYYTKNLGWKGILNYFYSYS